MVEIDKARQWLSKHYDGMWASAAPAIRVGDIEIDEVLAGRQSDKRRGMTLIARPSSEVRACARKFIKELSSAEPDQYYYPATDLHITILPMFSATPQPERFIARADDYLAAVKLVLKSSEPIRVEFRGVTASRGAVLIQGFPENSALNDLREKLREELRLRGLDERVDSRYKLQTAHMTVARFRAPLRNGYTFVKHLAAQRDRAFGMTSIRSFQLVKNDWYMRIGHLEKMKFFRR